MLKYTYIIVIVTICFSMYGCFGSSTINNVEIDTSLNLSLNALDIPDIILSDLMFAKAILLGSNKPDLPLWFTLKPFTESECIIGDTIVLMCGVNGNWNPDNLIVKVSTSDETKNFLLTLNQDVGYILNYPNSHKCYTAFIPYIQSLPDGRTDSVIRVNQKGDILTAEIEYLNQKLTTTLKMKEK